jgi:hypothetical protein
MLMEVEDYFICTLTLLREANGQEQQHGIISDCLVLVLVW